VCTSWGVKGKQLFLLSVFRRRLEYPALKRAVREQQSLFQASVVLIEDKASGTQLIQELILEGCHAVTRYQPECDKVMRLHAQTALIENFVFISETAPWLAEYLHEMRVFPKGNMMTRSIRPRSSSTGSSARFPTKGSSSFTGSSRRRLNYAATGSPSDPNRRSAPRNGLLRKAEGLNHRAPLRHLHPFEAINPHRRLSSPCPERA